MLSVSASESPTPSGLATPEALSLGLLRSVLRTIYVAPLRTATIEGSRAAGKGT